MDSGHEPGVSDGDHAASTRTRGHRWLALGGGGVPEANQISIEQDLALAASVLGSGGRILFANQVFFTRSIEPPLKNLPAEHAYVSFEKADGSQYRIAFLTPHPIEEQLLLESEVIAAIQRGACNVLIVQAE